MMEIVNETRWVENDMIHFPREFAQSRRQNFIQKTTSCVEIYI